MNKKVLAILSIIVISLLTISAAPAKTYANSGYMERFNKLKKKCNKKFKYNGPQQEMNHESLEEFKLWDKELNYVYNDIYGKLNQEDQKELKKSELAWIKKRDKKAAEKSSEFEGGTMYPLVYNDILIKLTKKRIKWLIKNY
ncbi:MAG: lysozyme inhibitor LprI family protein [Lachnospiraceae bacterium]